MEELGQVPLLCSCLWSLWGSSGRMLVPALKFLKERSRKVKKQTASLSTQAPLSFRAARGLTGRQCWTWRGDIQGLGT